jgi:hypothetical protein
VKTCWMMVPPVGKGNGFRPSTVSIPPDVCVLV